MNPTADLDTVLGLEREIEAAALEAIVAWLPAARTAVLPALTAAAVIPPDPDAIAVQAADEWERELDARLMPRIAEIAGRLTASAADRLSGWRTGYLASVRSRLTGIPANAARSVRAAIERAGASVEAMREQVAEALSPEAWGPEAARIGRTEGIGVFNGARLAAATAEEQDTGQALDKQWLSLQDDRTRASHVHADRQRVPLSAKFRVGDSYLEFPGDPNGPADEVCNCRCIVVVLNSDPAQNSLAASAAGGGTTMARTFEAMIIPTGVVGRSQGWMLANNVEFVDTVLPLAFKWQRTADPGHDGAYTVAVLEAVQLRDGAVWGTGTMLDSPEALEAIQQIEAGVTRPSVELVARSEVLTDTAGSPLSPETAEQMWMDGAAVVSRIDVAEIVAATLVSVPEFRDAHMILGETEQEAGHGLALVAAATARTVEPDVYPAGHFEDPGLTEPTPIYVTPEGQVAGHLACWETMHTAYPDMQVTPYRSYSGYAVFHQSDAHLDNGEIIGVGRLTVGGGHGPAGKGMRAALEHYDDVTTCWAKVRAGEDEFGIWVSGVIEASASDQMVKLALGTPHSGHWERVGGHPELLIGHAVNSPGFPIMAARRMRDRDGDLALVASFAPRQARPPMPPSLMEDIAARAVARYAEQQAGQQRAAHARELVAAASDRRRAQAQAIITGRKAS